MSKRFNRRIYSLKTLLSDVKYLISNRKDIKAIKKNKEISDSFFEKIMTVVTAVNGCVYCTWFHAKKAASTGISDDEIKNMLDLQFQTDTSDNEITALLYAQHYAETNRNPDEEMTKKLYDFYGENTAKQIMLIIRMIYFGNLSGNTFDAFLYRFKGQKAEKSNFLFEFFFFIFSAPILLPTMPVVKKYR